METKYYVTCMQGPPSDDNSAVFIDQEEWRVDTSRWHKCYYRLLEGETAKCTKSGKGCFFGKNTGIYDNLYSTYHPEKWKQAYGICEPCFLFVTDNKEEQVKNWGKRLAWCIHGDETGGAWVDAYIKDTGERAKEILKNE